MRSTKLNTLKFFAGIVAFALGHVMYIRAFGWRPFNTKAFVFFLAVALSLYWSVDCFLEGELTLQFVRYYKLLYDTTIAAEYVFIVHAYRMRCLTATIISTIL